MNEALLKEMQITGLLAPAGGCQEVQGTRATPHSRCMRISQQTYGGPTGTYRTYGVPVHASPLMSSTENSSAHAGNAEPRQQTQLQSAFGSPGQWESSTVPLLRGFPGLSRWQPSGAGQASRLSKIEVCQREDFFTI